MPQVSYDLGGFEASLKQIAERINQSPALVRKKVCFDLFESIVAKTPRDTGRAAASWNMTDNAPDYSSKPEAEEPNMYQGAEAASQSAKFADPFGATHIANGLPYIVPLEFGHSSKQAPNGMVRIALAELEAHLQSTFNLDTLK